MDTVVSALRIELPRADRLIVTGDLAHDEQRETYVAIRELLGEWIEKLRVVPGNHDDRDSMRLLLGDDMDGCVPDRNLFSERLSGWRLIGLDTHWPGETRGRLSRPQLTWLDRELTAARDEPTALFLHHPPVSVGSPWLDRLELVDAGDLAMVLVGFPQVKLICAGHVHQEQTVRLGHATVLTTPSTGIQFRPETEGLEIDDIAPGYRILELDADGGFRSRVVRVPVASESAAGNSTVRP